MLLIIVCFVFFREQAGRPKCPVDPFFIVPDKCKCVDYQTLKLQESPDAVPNGELPRHMQLFVDRSVNTVYCEYHLCMLAQETVDNCGMPDLQQLVPFQIFSGTSCSWKSYFSHGNLFY